MALKGLFRKHFGCVGSLLVSFNDRKICHSDEGYVLAICLKMKQGRVFLLILVQCHSGF